MRHPFWNHSYPPEVDLDYSAVKISCKFPFADEVGRIWPGYWLTQGCSFSYKYITALLWDLDHIALGQIRRVGALSVFVD